MTNQHKKVSLMEKNKRVHLKSLSEKGKKKKMKGKKRIFHKKETLFSFSSAFSHFLLTLKRAETPKNAMNPESALNPGILGNPGNPGIRDSFFSGSAFIGRQA